MNGYKDCCVTANEKTGRSALGESCNNAMLRNILHTVTTTQSRLTQEVMALGDG